MGIVGSWIDSLNDRERDAIIEHPDPTYDGRDWWDVDRGCGCLVGCVVDATMQGRDHTPQSELRGMPYRAVHAGVWAPERTREAGDVGALFPRLTARFTPERMWRLVKARAAKGNRISLPERETEAVGD